MGLTLEELELVIGNLTRLRYDRGEAVKVIEREIRLKKLEKLIPKMDVSGRDIEE